jgi:CRP/FNR family cyclic AMP-dependent transcriptional regulator
MTTIHELDELEVFSEFNPEQKKKLSLIARRMNFKKGDEVYLSRYRANRVFVLVEGKVDLRVLNPDGAVGVSFGTLGDGKLFGGSSLLKPQDYTVTALCDEDCELLVMESNALIDLMDQDHELGHKLMKKVAGIYFDRYERTKNQIHEMIKATTLVAVPAVL